MHNRIAILVAAGLLAACASPDDSQASRGRAAERDDKVETRRDGTSTAYSLEGYKRDIAQRISQTNSTRVYVGRPQALLRSVVVVRYVVDGSGSLVRSEIMRSNRDRETEATALASLRGAAPFPKPAPHLLRHGRLELAETWLFNTDGRFQLRTIAEPQMDQ